jgi:P4 family phage/plasmid primase-like protien
MAKPDVPAAAWMAGEFLKATNLRWYAEDVFAYGGGLYRPVSRAWLQAKVQAFLVEVLGAEKVGSAFVNEVGQCVRNHAFLDEGLKPPFWIPDGREADVVVASNTVVRLDSLATSGRAECLPHTPDLFALCGVPYRFDPEARCPKWIEFVGWMVGGNEGEARLLQEFCGWTFLAKRLRLEKILWLCGPGRNGKSTFLKVARYVIGESATSAVGLEAFSGGENFKLWPTLNKLANFCNDAQVKRTSNPAALNSFVSGDPFTVNRKFREQLTVEPTTACYFASNPMPLYSDASDAFWRRLLLVRCLQRLSDDQADPGLLEALKAEAAGIFNWMLEPIPRLLAQGRFDVPESVRQNVDSLKSEVNAARQFIREKVQAGHPDCDWIVREQLMGIFSLWCQSNGFKAEALPVVKEEMRLALNVELVRRRKGLSPRDRVLCWMGVKWKLEEDVRTIDVAAKQNDYLKAALQDNEVEMGRLRAEKDAEIARLKGEIQDAIARSQPKPVPAPPNPPETEKERRPMYGEAERAADYERYKRGMESEPLADPAEYEALIAKLKGGWLSNATAADAQ